MGPWGDGSGVVGPVGSFREAGVGGAGGGCGEAGVGAGGSCGEAGLVEVGSERGEESVWEDKL